MDRTELIKKLDGFRQACAEAGCINIDNENAFQLEEAYPGAKPASFIINVTVKQEWLDKEYPVSALRELIELLYKKADADVRKNILTVRICGIDEWPSLEIQQPKEAA